MMKINTPLKTKLHLIYPKLMSNYKLSKSISENHFFVKTARCKINFVGRFLIIYILIVPLTVLKASDFI